MEKCFACGKKIEAGTGIVSTRDDQFPKVGSECFKLVVKAGEAGYQPPKGGPRLWQITNDELHRYNSLQNNSFIAAMDKWGTN